MAQLDYSLYLPVGVEGGLFDINPMDIISPVCTEEITPGKAVVKVAGETTLKAALPTGTSTAAMFLGVSVFIQQLMNTFVIPGASESRPYAEGEAISVITRGRVWVKVEEDVDVDSPVYFRITASGSTEVGAFRASAASGSAILLSNAKFYRGASAGGLAVLELR